MSEVMMELVWKSCNLAFECWRSIVIVSVNKGGGEEYIMEEVKGN